MTNQHELAAFLLRITLAALFLAHAALKIFVFTPAGTAGFFSSLGLPGFVAYLTIAAELVGAAALVAGFMTRWVSLALGPILLGSIIFVHGANGWLFSAPNGGWEFPAFWAVALIVQALLGDGVFSLQVQNGKPRFKALEA